MTMLRDQENEKSLKWEIRKDENGTYSLYLNDGTSLRKVLEGKLWIDDNAGILKNRSNFLIAGELDGKRGLYMWNGNEFVKVMEVDQNKKFENYGIINGDSEFLVVLKFGINSHINYLYIWDGKRFKEIFRTNEDILDIGLISGESPFLVTLNTNPDPIYLDNLDPYDDVEGVFNLYVWDGNKIVKLLENLKDVYIGGAISGKGEFIITTEFDEESGRLEVYWDDEDNSYEYWRMDYMDFMYRWDGNNLVRVLDDCLSIERFGLVDNMANFVITTDRNTENQSLRVWTGDGFKTILEGKKKIEACIVDETHSLISVYEDDESDKVILYSWNGKKLRPLVEGYHFVVFSDNNITVVREIDKEGEWVHRFYYYFSRDDVLYPVYEEKISGSGMVVSYRSHGDKNTFNWDDRIKIEVRENNEFSLIKVDSEKGIERITILLKQRGAFLTIKKDKSVERTISRKKNR